MSLRPRQLREPKGELRSWREEWVVLSERGLAAWVPAGGKEGSGAMLGQPVARAGLRYFAGLTLRLNLIFALFSI